MGQNKDLYSRLNIPKNASLDDIKKAYKKEALKWHPDRNQHQKELADEKFKEIAEAYEILSDPNQKKIYDQVGLDGMKQHGNPGMQTDFGDMFSGGNMRHGTRTFHFSSGGSNASDIFKMFFQNNSGMFMHDDMGWFSNNIDPFNKTNVPLQKDITHILEIPLKILFMGGTKKLKISNGKDSKICVVEIQPGWKSNTKVVFPADNNNSIGMITVIIKELPHNKFIRKDGIIKLQSKIFIRLVEVLLVIIYTFK